MLVSLVNNNLLLTERLTNISTFYSSMLALITIHYFENWRKNYYKMFILYQSEKLLLIILFNNII